MTADEKGFQRAGIGILHGGMLGQVAELAERGRADPQQPAHFAGSVDRPRLDPLDFQQVPEQGFGPVAEVGGRLAPADAPKTAWGAFWRAHGVDPLPTTVATRPPARSWTLPDAHFTRPQTSYPPPHSPYPPSPPPAVSRVKVSRSPL